MAPQSEEISIVRPSTVEGEVEDGEGVADKQDSARSRLELR